MVLIKLIMIYPWRAAESWRHERAFFSPLNGCLLSGRIGRPESEAAWRGRFKFFLPTPRGHFVTWETQTWFHPIELWSALEHLVANQSCFKHCVLGVEPIQDQCQYRRVLAGFYFTFFVNIASKCGNKLWQLLGTNFGWTLTPFS